MFGRGGRGRVGRKREPSFSHSISAKQPNFFGVRRLAAAFAEDCCPATIFPKSVTVKSDLRGGIATRRGGPHSGPSAGSLRSRGRTRRSSSKPLIRRRAHRQPPVAAVIGDEHSIRLEALEPRALGMGGEAGDVEVRPQPECALHPREVVGRLVAGEMGGRVGVRAGGRSPNRKRWRGADQAGSSARLAYDRGEDGQARGVGRGPFDRGEGGFETQVEEGRLRGGPAVAGLPGLVNSYSFRPPVDHQQVAVAPPLALDDVQRHAVERPSLNWRSSARIGAGVGFIGVGGNPDRDPFLIWRYEDEAHVRIEGQRLLGADGGDDLLRPRVQRAFRDVLVPGAVGREHVERGKDAVASGVLNNTGCLISAIAGRSPSWVDPNLVGFAARCAAAGLTQLPAVRRLAAQRADVITARPFFMADPPATSNRIDAPARPIRGLGIAPPPEL